MNILDHILAGHYPTDDKGRALVPMRGGCVATIYATDAPGIARPIAGCDATGVSAWKADGSYHLSEESTLDLLPPPPRKVKVTAWAVMYGDGRLGHFLGSREDADKFAAGWKHHNAFVVELVGEYEEPFQ